jgi:putative phosphoribosyl transferase
MFSTRAAAGSAVASALSDRHLTGDVLVLALPRGGVPVARVVADALGAPLDVIVARKLGVPGMEEVALGAIAEGRRDIVEDSVRWYLGVPAAVVARIVERERRELDRRARVYRGGASLPNVRGRTVILVDDGLASGTTMRAAALSVRLGRPARIVAAVPVASLAHCDDVRRAVDDLVAIATPDPFGTVSEWYDDFDAVTDAEVLRLLGRTSQTAVDETRVPPGTTDERTVTIPLSLPEHADESMGADVGIPDDSPTGLVMLAHGGGSSRNSYRNRYLAGRLRQEGWATMRIDLLLDREREADEITGDARFDVSRIGTRLVSAIDWAVRERLAGAHRIVLFGASTGAAAAMVAAAARPDAVIGVASRGGRVDLAGAALSEVRAPTLMVVGGADIDTLRLTRASAKLLGASTRLTLIPHARHTFEEPGAIGAVGEHVVRWLAGLRPGRAAVRSSARSS